MVPLSLFRCVLSPFFVLFRKYIYGHMACIPFGSLSVIKSKCQCCPWFQNVLIGNNRHHALNKKHIKHRPKMIRTKITLLQRFKYVWWRLHCRTRAVEKTTRSIVNITEINLAFRYESQIFLGVNPWMYHTHHCRYNSPQYKRTNRIGGVMVSVLVSRAVDRVHPKTMKLVCVASLLSAQN